jgi:hypothetical protein
VAERDRAAHRGRRRGIGIGRSGRRRHTGTGTVGADEILGSDRTRDPKQAAQLSKACANAAEALARAEEQWLEASTQFDEAAG